MRGPASALAVVAPDARLALALLGETRAPPAVDVLREYMRGEHDAHERQEHQMQDALGKCHRLR